MAVLGRSSRLVLILDTACAFFQQMRGQIEEGLAKREVYQRTYHELTSLTDRDLADIGISRHDIRRLAKEAAYGC